MTIDPTNGDRAKWAAVAIEAFAAATHTGGEDLDTQVADLVADLHHLCDANDVSFRACLERGHAHYQAELIDAGADKRQPGDDAGRTKAPELLLVAGEYAELFNGVPLEDIDRLIADACVDPFWDARTNLLSLLADEPENLGLVLATDPEDYVVVRYADSWIVDTSPVDWEALEDRAFAPGDDDGNEG